MRRGAVGREVRYTFEPDDNLTLMEFAKSAELLYYSIPGNTEGVSPDVCDELYENMGKAQRHWRTWDNEPKVPIQVLVELAMLKRRAGVK